MQKYFLTDSHAHLFSIQNGETIENIITRAQLAGVTTIVNICTDEDNIDRGMEIAKRFPGIYNAAAVHPHDTEKEGASYFPQVVKHAKSGDLIAIGETGLDYHYQHSSHDIQRQYLIQHLQLAQECQLPVIIHCREAFVDLFEILDVNYRVGQLYGAGVLHCFTGTLAEAEQVLARDWYLSLSGIVTFKKSDVLREFARMVPLERLLIETDAPYLAPQSQRGKVNEPAYVVETATVIAAVKGISLNELAQATTANAKRLFDIF